MCDASCMFLGDCCFDYIMECRKGKRDTNNALTEQSNFYQQYEPYSSCAYYALEDHPDFVLQIGTCPTTNGDLAELCRGDLGKRTFSWYIPVMARGILFNNVYCAACHGIRLQEVDIVTSTYDIKCGEPDSSSAHFAPFQQMFDCKTPMLIVDSKYHDLERFKSVCACDQVYSIYSECNHPTFKEECHAYAAVIQQERKPKVSFVTTVSPLRWRHNGHDGVSNHQPHDCLLNRLFRDIWNKTSKPCATGLCAGNSPETGEFPTQNGQ